jgi:hypothetical protein
MMSLKERIDHAGNCDEVESKAGNTADLYDWVNQTLQQLNHDKLKRSGRGLVRCYLAKMTGLGRAQATRCWGCTCAERMCSRRHITGAGSQRDIRTVLLWVSVGSMPVERGERRMNILQ